MSLKFKTETKSIRMNVRLCVGTRLLDVCLMRCGRDVHVVKSQLLMLAKFWLLFHKKPDVVCFGGVTVDVLETLDKMPSSKIGLDYLCTTHNL